MLTMWDVAAAQFKPRAHTWPTPGALAHTIDPRTVDTPALDLIDTELTTVLNTPDGRLIISMPPQEGKSTRVSRDYIVWALTINPDLRIVTASYGQGLANRNGRTARNVLASHPELGLTIAADNGAVAEWQIAGHDGGVLSVGRGAGVTGRPCDLLVIDDPIKDRAEADSATVRQTCWDWWTDSLSTRLAPGAPVVLILTRWHHDDLAGRLLAAPDGHLWRVVNIPAQAESENDPLSRAPGQFMVSARGRTPAQWEAIKTRVGSRTWASLYQGNPTPGEGGVFPTHVPQYTHPLHVVRDDGTRVIPDLGPTDEVFQSWDMTFKDTPGADFVVGQVWIRRGPDMFLLDQVRGRWSFTQTVDQMVALTARWPQAVAKLVEDKANGTAVMDLLRARIPGLIPVEPAGGKVARANAVAPLFESQNVHLPDPVAADAPWVADLLQEMAEFPAGQHDDQVDGMTQAVRYGLLVPIMQGRTLTADDLTADLDDDYQPDWAPTY